PLKWGLVLLSENRVGLIGELQNDSYINPNELFFIGGSGLGFSEPLRGYDDGRAGPRGGGKSMVRFTTELRIP
ncbi:MAG: BamA/TamA family outer membrane protein, partial [Calditrichae bacterium]|nr:BamA/TamA family outer membrane protein [Calditrichia bacterium]